MFNEPWPWFSGNICVMYGLWGGAGIPKQSVYIGFQGGTRISEPSPYIGFQSSCAFGSYWELGTSADPVLPQGAGKMRRDVPVKGLLWQSYSFFEEGLIDLPLLRVLCKAQRNVVLLVAGAVSQTHCCRCVLRLRMGWYLLYQENGTKRTMVQFATCWPKNTWSLLAACQIQPPPHPSPGDAPASAPPVAQPGKGRQGWNEDQV